MSNNDGLVSRVIAKLHQHKAKEFGKLKYAPNFNKASRFILAWDSSCSPAETKAIKEYIEYLKIPLPENGGNNNIILIKK